MFGKVTGVISVLPPLPCLLLAIAVFLPTSGTKGAMQDGFGDAGTTFLCEPLVWLQDHGHSTPYLLTS